MKIKRKITVVVPGEELGKLIASEKVETQSRVLTGLAKHQLLRYVAQPQPITELAEHISDETVLWFVRVYRELVRSDRVSKDLDKMMHENLRQS